MNRWRLLAAVIVCIAGLGFATQAILPAAAQRLLDRPRGEDGRNRGDDGRPRDTEVVERTVPFPAGGTLRVRNFSGAISITSTSGRDVVLRATRRAPRETLDHVSLEVTTSGTTVTVEANRRDPQWQRSRDSGDVVDTEMTIEVPRAADLDIDAFSSDIVVEGAGADQRLKTFSGRITVRGLTGEIDASTFSADIDVTLAENGGGRVSFDSFSGRLDSDVPISTTSMSRRRNNRIEGSLAGDSDRRLRFKTFSGDVQLRRR